jgi:glutathione reductase (NADPH)
MTGKMFNTIIVGSGKSGYFVAYGLSWALQKVAIIDERPYGGACVLRVCQPKKCLVLSYLKFHSIF